MYYMYHLHNIVSAEKVKLLKPDCIYKGNYFLRFPWSLLPLFGLAVLIQALGTDSFGMGFRLHRCHISMWNRQYIQTYETSNTHVHVIDHINHITD